MLCHNIIQTPGYEISTIDVLELWGAVNQRAPVAIIVI